VSPHVKDIPRFHVYKTHASQTTVNVELAVSFLLICTNNVFSIKCFQKIAIRYTQLNLAYGVVSAVRARKNS
jgi:hypothetical protein